jgi:hypothetical protein
VEKWVISPFLNETHITILHDEQMLRDFSICSKPVIVTNIINYLNGDGDLSVKEMLREVYKDKISFLDIQKDDVVIGNVDKVYQYTFDSVHAGLTIDELKSMKETINSVYNDEYNIPYVNVIPGDIIAGIINNLLALHRVNKNIEYKRLAYLLTKNKELFKDKPNANAKGTLFKTVSRRSTDLDIILNGIDFLITQKQEGKQPESWRVF